MEDVYYNEYVSLESRSSRNLIWFLSIVAAAILSWTPSALPAEKSRQSEDTLLDTYGRIEDKLTRNGFDFPLYLESSDLYGRCRADVYGIIDHPFGSVLNELTAPSNWCEVASLHTNVKACTYTEMHGSWRLVLYVGTKTYQAPEEASQFAYHYRIAEQRPSYLNITLDADEGPYGTKDHRMRLEALPLSAGRTFIHVSYGYGRSSPLRLLEKIYFATLGRGKVGFTVIGTDGGGSPLYVEGSRGAIERNAVRYYLGVKAFMDTLRYPAENRFDMRISEWYDLTCHFKKQLFEMEKKDYLFYKAEEHKKQTILQQRCAAAHDGGR